jgi:alpha-glucosidase (family GH31 glycosyl hydrolase)
MYTLFYMAHTYGGTVANSLWMNFPDDPTAVGVDTQFMLGNAVMIAPALQEGTDVVHAYFPPSVWYNYQNFSMVIDTQTGGAYVDLQTPLTTCNVFVRGGTILPLQRAEMTTTASRKSPFTLLIALDANQSATGTLFLDQGDEIMDPHVDMGGQQGTSEAGTLSMEYTVSPTATKPAADRNNDPMIKDSQEFVFLANVQSTMVSSALNFEIEQIVIVGHTLSCPEVAMLIVAGAAVEMLDVTCEHAPDKSAVSAVKLSRNANSAGIPMCQDFVVEWISI